MDSRESPGPATPRHHDSVLECLRKDVFPIEMTTHAYALIDSFVYGFTIQELNISANSESDIRESVDTIEKDMSADEYPFLAELSAEHIFQPAYDFGKEFYYGLDLILDGLENCSDGSTLKY